MVSQKFLVTLLAAYLASAIPLNINLGAYSPALVVGDGEISFGGSPERASEVLQTLATGAENGAVPVGQTVPAPAAPAGGELGQKAPAKKMLARRSVDVEERDEPAFARKLRRDIDGFREALNFARDAQKNTPKVELRTGITQFAGSAVPINSAANGALPPGAKTAEKRQIEEPSKRDDTSLGMTLIAIGEI